jgi:RimJ/RimL family protein N-acetyltransferase
MNDLETDRLILRQWKTEDRPSFALMSADPEAMRYLGGIWDRATSDNFIERQIQHFAGHGYGICAIELKESGEFIGFTGIRHVPFEAHFTPAIEIGWRLSSRHWNKGYMTEAAKRVLDYGLNDLKLDEIVSFTSPLNVLSKRVMEKLGMTSDPKDNFRHPSVPADDILSEHVLYRMKNPVASRGAFIARLI